MPNYHLIFETSCGASGDMLLAALLDLLPVEEEFVRRFEDLGLDVKIRCLAAEKNHLRCKQVVVKTTSDEKLRYFSDIRAFIDKTPFSGAVKSHSLRVFERIFQAEAAVHGEDLKEVHLHELGADDSIIDIMGFCWLWEKLEFAPVFFTTLYTGKGHIKTRHGRLPVPPPAVLRLIEGFLYKSGEIDFEILTPTGAAILTTLGKQIGDDFPIIPVKTGTGCGERSFPDTPNILRAILAKSIAPEASAPVRVIEFFVDDMTGEAIGHLGERLLESGALDYFIATGQMKKGRTGFKLTILCPEESFQSVMETIFSESTTIGFRIRRENRMTLDRVEREARIGSIPVRYKIASFSGKEFNRKPEFADVKVLAEKMQISFKEAYSLVLRKIYEKDQSG